MEGVVAALNPQLDWETELPDGTGRYDDIGDNVNLYLKDFLLDNLDFAMELAWKNRFNNTITCLENAQQSILNHRNVKGRSSQT